MITRRLFTGAFIASAALALGSASAPAQTPPSSFDPPGIINAIYTRVTTGNGDGGGAFVTQGKAARAKYLSKSLVALWAKSDAHTPEGDVVIDFDPVTNSQDPSVKSFAVTSEKLDSGTATIAVTMTTGYARPSANPADVVVRYDFVRDGGHWKIDDIRGAVDGKPWSLRALLTRSLKN